MNDIVSPLVCYSLFVCPSAILFFIFKYFRNYTKLIMEVIATTQPTTQNKTTQLGWCGIILGKQIPTPPPVSHYISDSFRQPRKLIFSMQPYFNSIIRNMEDDHNIFENGRHPQLFFEEGR
jgi:hypothetical protein